MKKKLMMVAVLLGALSLGACVDDNESASVTAIRNAKAAQLESIAALNNAQAQAAATAAEAEAALKAAQAAYQQALAAAEQADADYQAELTRQAQEKFALELEALQAEYAADIASFNALKAQYEKDLWDNVDDHISAVYGAYTTILNNVNTLTESKLKAQVRKAQAEAEVISAEEVVKQTLASYNKQLTQKQNQLAKLQEMQAMQPSTEDYEKQMVELEKQAYDIVVNQKPEAEAAEKVAKEAYEDIVEAVTEGEYKFAAAAEALNDMASNYLSTQNFASAESIDIAEDECDAYYDEWGATPDGTFSVTMYELTASQVERATLAANRAFEQKLERADAAIETATGEAWEEDEDGVITPDWLNTTSLNGAKSEVAYWEQQIKAKDEEIADKEDELNKAIEDEEPEATINQLKSELEILEGQKKNYTENKEDAGVKVLTAEETLAEKEADKKEIEEAQKEYEANLAILNDATALKEYQDAFATIEPKAIEYINAQAEVQPFDDALAEIGIDGFDANGNITGSTSGQYAYLQQLVGGAKDVADLIDDCNADIVAIQNAIEMGALNELVSLQEVTKQIWNYVTGQNETVTVYHYVITSGSDITAADAVAIIEAEIAALDARIETETAMAEKYKAELDELIGASDDAEETPAA